MDQFWGDLPTWITTLAVGFGAAQLYQDRQQRRRQAETDARAQARALTSWTGSYRGQNGEANEYGLVISNDSGLPFRNVEVDVVVHGASQATAEMVILPPGKFFLQLLQNGGAWQYAMSVDEYGKSIRPYTRTRKYRVAEVRLTDAAGRSWRIDGDGGLHAASDRRSTAQSV